MSGRHRLRHAPRAMPARCDQARPQCYASGMNAGETPGDPRLYRPLCAYPHRPVRRRAGVGPAGRPRRDRDPGAGGAPPNTRPRGDRRGDPGLRQPGRRRQPQRRPHGAAARGAARSAVPGATVNRLCGSGMDAVAIAAAPDRGRRGGPCGRRRRREHVARPLRHAEGGHRLFTPRRNPRHDDRLALRRTRRMRQLYGTESMPETAENVAEDFDISRADQDAFAARSQARAVAAQANGRLGAGDRAGRDPPARAARPVGRDRRASARRHDRRGAGETADALPRGRDRHGRQRLRASTTAPPRCWSLPSAPLRRTA